MIDLLDQGLESRWSACPPEVDLAEACLTSKNRTLPVARSKRPMNTISNRSNRLSGSLTTRALPEGEDGARKAALSTLLACVPAGVLVHEEHCGQDGEGLPTVEYVRLVTQLHVVALDVAE